MEPPPQRSRQSKPEQSRQASQRFAHGSCAQNRHILHNDARTEPLKSSDCDGIKQRASAGTKNDERNVDRALRQVEREVGEMMNDMLSTHSNHKGNPPILGMCWRREGENGWKLQEDTKLHFFIVHAESILSLGRISPLRHCIFFGIFS